MTLAAGTRLDAYEILGLLGAGGMGEVYRARDPALKREVAIKVLPSLVSRDPDRLLRFEQEAQAVAALDHPNILAVHQFGVFEGTPYLVSELLVGESLRQVLQRGPLPVRKAVDYAVQIAHGLAAAHDKGIVHRDLKPENLFVTKDGRVKILDFGLAKLTHAESNAADTTQGAGAHGPGPHYAALPGKEPRRAISVGARSRIQSGDAEFALRHDGGTDTGRTTSRAPPGFGVVARGRHGCRGARGRCPAREVHRLKSTYTPL